jgi:outer membrane protein assembly factor BamD (BamD/ComL family)
VTSLVKAGRNYRRYLSERPDGEHRQQASQDLVVVEEELARSELLKAEVYVARENGQGARIHFANVALAFPQSKAAEVARDALAKNGWDLSLNSVDTLTLPPGVELEE